MAKALHNQSLLDVAVQHTGTIASLVDLAINNEISITDDLVLNSDLNVKASFIDADIKQYYESKKLIPATELTQELKSNLPSEEGISAMGVSGSFIIR